MDVDALIKSVPGEAQNAVSQADHLVREIRRNLFHQRNRVLLRFFMGDFFAARFIFYPRIEAGQPTVCSETCVGRIRYLGVLLYDADAIERAASTENEKDLYQRQLEVFLDPNDPKVIEQAIKDGIPLSVIEAAQQSPVYKMAMEWKLALPLHPEYRTLPMVWYVPPLSPIQSAADAGELGSNGILPDVESLRIPVQYLANLLTAGDTKPVLRALKRMLAMRHYKRAETVDGKVDTRALEEAEKV